MEVPTILSSPTHCHPGHGYGHHHNCTHHHHHHHVGRSFGWGAGVALGEVQPRCKVTCSVAYSSTYSTFSSYHHHYFMTHHHQNSFKEYDLLKETIMICWRNIKLQNGVLQSYRVVPLFMQEPTACIQAASDLTNPGALTLSCVHCKPPLRYL